MTATHDIVGIGNAIMDIIAPVDDSFLIRNDIVKGSMTLIDEATALRMSKVLPTIGRVEVAGGSGANTIAGAAMMGASTAYIGVVADDAVGARFTDNMRSSGVTYDTPAQSGGLATARCLIAVTPDGERSMSTFLGASTQFNDDNLDEATVASGKIVYLEGYLFDSDEAKAAYVKASEITKAAGNKVALTLSDSFCVERHREAFRHLVKNHIDILFANEDEITTLYETDNFEDAVKEVSKLNILAALTRSKKGSSLIQGRSRIDISIEPAEQLVDTTGAGDQYAAGFLAAYSKGEGLAECGRWASLAAAEVISHYGARPERKIKV
ncbi:adenosine kinase [Robiginitomaculum antarcticum]|uniref:adenosine kinase n=1 Tax=Robiginitomaculum antarcticum TaxID=437507 RepID=UPI0003749921|nr:adenosine kinase [Robiginitomaculum antarcticum]